MKLYVIPAFGIPSSKRYRALLRIFGSGIFNTGFNHVIYA
jgi:hypothetical protein